MKDRFRCLYLSASHGLGEIDEPDLADTTERHKVRLTPFRFAAGPPLFQRLEREADLVGLVCEMNRGWAGPALLWPIGRVLRRGRRVWLYWPDEEVVECVDRERLASHWRHWFFIQTYIRLWMPWQRINERYKLLRAEVPLHRLPRWFAGRVRRALRRADGGASMHRKVSATMADLHRFEPCPVPMLVESIPLDRKLTSGTGVYLRTDFWTQMQSGGSYGHTCFVAKELAADCGGFVCFLPYRYSLLDDYGVHQVVLDPPAEPYGEDVIATATSHYVPLLKPALEALRPSFIYERLCLGNYAGAILSRQLGIPYIVEYNGSEISMRRSFEGTGYVHERLFLKAEEIAFAQATAISVISEQVRATLLDRGVDPSKVLVNPNGADIREYAPGTPTEKQAIRGRLGFTDGDIVVGFTGTFGGWHGIDVLAFAIPDICSRDDHVKFLLIGDGNLKTLVDTAVARNGLESRVVSTGRVPQREGAVLLKACDIFVSPHSSHMVDGRFFGSPTKIFEYMSVGGAIVASNLEQIGQTLSPALTPADLEREHLPVTNQRAVLCAAGSVPELVDAVLGLARQPDVRRALGANAREAVVEHYAWSRHTDNLWRFIERSRDGSPPVTERHIQDLIEGTVVAAGSVASQPVPRLQPAAAAIQTGDAYKDEVQRQWDHDPVGSQYVKIASPHTLGWFQEAEAYRYNEYAPWMPETMEFARHSGEQLLEIGGGMGTDLARFAMSGADVTDLDLSSGHLEHARENFRLRGLRGRFVHHDAERLPFEDNSFDLVYSNGVLHHTPNTHDAVEEIRRVLKPGGRTIVMMYAENSLHYWRNLVGELGLEDGQLYRFSMGEIMSRSVERSERSGARPLVKVYTKRRLKNLFSRFTDVEIVQRQLMQVEVPALLRRMPLSSLGKMMGWNLIVKASKPEN